MKKQGFHRWAWLVIFAWGGLMMLYGGAQDMLLFFAPELALVPSWYVAPPIVGLVCGLIVALSAGLNIMWGWQLRHAVGEKEIALAHRVVLVSAVAIVADWASGYYGCGSMASLLIGLWLMQRKNVEKKKLRAKKLKNVEKIYLFWFRRSGAKASGNAHHYSGFCSKNVRTSSKKHRHIYGLFFILSLQIKIMGLVFAYKW